MWGRFVLIQKDQSHKNHGLYPEVSCGEQRAPWTSLGASHLTGTISQRNGEKTEWEKNAFPTCLPRENPGDRQYDAF